MTRYRHSAFTILTTTLTRRTTGTIGTGATSAIGTSDTLLPLLLRMMYIGNRATDDAEDNDQGNVIKQSHHRAPPLTELFLPLLHSQISTTT